MALDGIPLGHRVVALAVRVLRVGVVDRRILAVLAVVLGVITATGQAVAVERGRGHVDVGAGRLEAALRRPVLDLPDAAGVVDEAVLAVDLARRELGLDFVATVGRLEAVAVAAVLVVSAGPRRMRDSVSEFG